MILPSPSGGAGRPRWYTDFFHEKTLWGILSDVPHSQRDSGDGLSQQPPCE